MLRNFGVIIYGYHETHTTSQVDHGYKEWRVRAVGFQACKEKGHILNPKDISSTDFSLFSSPRRDEANWFQRIYLGVLSRFLNFFQLNSRRVKPAAS